MALPLTVPLLSIVNVCGEVTLNEPNEPVDNEEPLINVVEPLKLKFKSVTLVENDALDSVIEPLPSSNATLVEKEPLSVCNASTLPSSVVTLVLNEELASVNDPLIVVLAVEPNEESHTPVSIVPTEVIFV